MSQLRHLVAVLQDRLQEDAAHIQVLVGPRQVGKTTALRAALKDRGVYETADRPTPFDPMVIEEWWKKALQSPAKILAIDEIQKIPGWSEVLKKLWDENDRRLKVMVTGSSALLVEKGLKETLAGRFELIRAEHWNFEEASTIFRQSLENFIEFGCYPGAMPLFKRKGGIERWGLYVRDAIVEPALGRDLLQLHPVDQPALLRQIFAVAVQLPCQIVSLQKMQGQLQGRGSLPTIQNYLRLLADAYLITGLHKYHPASFRSRQSSPKLIVHDNALIRAFERPMDQKPSEEKWGRYFENCIGARFVEAGWETYYWKDRDLEVDFVVLGPGGEKWAVEVKTGTVNRSDLRGLLKFCELHPSFEPVLIGLRAPKVENIRMIHARDILRLSHEYSK